MEAVLPPSQMVFLLFLGDSEYSICCVQAKITSKSTKFIGTRLDLKFIVSKPAERKHGKMCMLFVRCNVS